MSSPIYAMDGNTYHATMPELLLERLVIVKAEGLALTITESFSLKNVPRNTWSSAIESAMLHIHVSTAAQNRQKA